MDLETYGWDKFFASNFAAHAERGLKAGRVYLEDRRTFWLYTEEGELRAQVSGRLAHHSRSRADLPAVGDWVAYDMKAAEKTRTSIHAVLPRISKFSRKVAGSAHEEQIVGANIDTVFLVSGLDNDFNLRRIERYLVMVAASGSNALIVLNKADLCDDLEKRLADVRSVARDVPVVAISAKAGSGMDSLEEFLGAGETVALIGSSGVGKSSIVNNLLGYRRQDVGEVRESDDRGTHTTTKRELMVLPSGSLILDTPGMRELQFWFNVDSLDEVFDDVAELAAKCFYSDCDHSATADCSIQQALATGELEETRWESYKKLATELEAIAEDQRTKSSRRSPRTKK